MWYEPNNEKYVHKTNTIGQNLAPSKLICLRNYNTILLTRRAGS